MFSITSACRHEARNHSEPRWLTLNLQGSQTLQKPTLAFQPADAVRASRFGSGRTIRVLARRLPFVVRVPGYCPLEVESHEAAEHTLRPLLKLPRVIGQVGFDTRLVVKAEPGCDSARQGRVRWRQVAGPVVETESRERGFALHLRTPKAPQALLAAGPHGLVAVSAAQQRRLRFEARYEGPSGLRSTQVVDVTPIARATGLSVFAVGQRVVLRGPEWTVRTRPTGSAATVTSRSTLQTFAADRPGRYTLQDADGCQLTLHTGRHDEIPLDCGRAPCHAAISEAARHTPMSASMRSLRVGASGDHEGCIPDCHFTGQAGVDDGGFTTVGRDMTFQPLTARAFDDLPVAMRRLGGVRCTACHGPSAIPPPQGRKAIVEASVCATCHDLAAPFDVVTRWKLGAMARSDQAEQTRTADCAGCHTTLGFLARIGARVQPRPAARRGPGDPLGVASGSDGEARPLAQVVEQSDGRTGIACAACHTAHATHRGRLIRDVGSRASAPPTSDADHVNRLCSQCHAPSDSEPLPSASAASLVLGTVGSLTSAGDPSLSGASPHANLPGGCTACHGHRDQGSVDHAFGVAPLRCQDCHDGSVVERVSQEGAAVRERAEKLADQVGEHCAGAALTSHAKRPNVPLSCDGEAALQAAYWVALVLRDDAAAAHNLGFARQLLDEAERRLGRAASR